MNQNEHNFRQILKVLHDENILKDMILIGSWSLLLYSNIFEEFKPLIRTTDVDFYIPNTKVVREKSGLIRALKQINYDVVFDTFSQKTRFISPDGFELEFLTKLNRDNLSCVKIGNTGIYAESISQIDIFTLNYVEIEFYGIVVKVASPASFILQKLLINSERKEKRQKDLDAIKYVLNFVKASKKTADELHSLFFSLPKKWQKKITKVISECEIDTFDIF